LTGSSDLYEGTGRRPSASINFITAHDGFTLNDVVSYNEKHNDENRDGSDDNRSWNCGAEGETSDPQILALRARQQRNLLSTLFLSQGVPMLQGGDELGRTQKGNNNCYCQDNELSWFDWENADLALLEYTRWLVNFRKEHAVFRRRRWFQGRSIRGLEDIAWFTPDGTEMSEEDWEVGYAKSLGVFLNGDVIPTTDPRGEPIRDDSFLLLLNAHFERMDFTMPVLWGERWSVVLDTAEPLPPSLSAEPDQRLAKSGESFSVESRSFVMLRRLA
jgi:glycogen operon protein